MKHLNQAPTFQIYQTLYKQDSNSIATPDISSPPSPYRLEPSPSPKVSQAKSINPFTTETTKKPKTLKLTKAQEKRLFTVLKSTDTDWKLTQHHFPKVPESLLKLTLSRLMRRCFAKMNRQFDYLVNSREIGQMKQSYLLKVFATFLRKGVQKMEGDAVSFDQLLSDYIFKPRSVLKTLYPPSQQKIIRFLLKRTVEIFEIEEIRQLRNIKIKKQLEKQQLGLERVDEIEFYENFEESRDDTLVSILDEYEKIRNAFRRIKANEENVFEKQKAVELFELLKKSMLGMEKHMRVQKGKKGRRGVECLFEEAKGKVVFCVERLKSARLTFAFENINELFMRSDSEE